MQKPFRILRALLALTLWLANALVPAQAQTAGDGAISGRVTNAITRGALEGAIVRVVELNRETTVARDGSFAFARVPAGRYTIEATYEGLQPQRSDAVVAVGQTATVALALTSEVYRLDQVFVSARLDGQASAINTQRTAPSLRTVVSADALGQIREGNIGDALVRLPGLSVETRAGVLRTATIRGLAPQYNTVNVDGLRMTNVDGDRNIALDSFPSNMLARVDVVKAPTPDLPADAIGGTVNLLTRSAFDREGRTLSFEAGTTYNDRLGNWNEQLGVTAGNTFGDRKQFGALVTLNYYHDLRGYDQVDQQYSINAANQYSIVRAYYYDRAEEKVRVGGGAAFDWRPADTAQLFAKFLYSYDYRDLDQRGTDYRPADGRVDVINNYREPKNVFSMFIAGGQHRFSDLTLDYRAAYSKAKKDYPKTLVVTNSFNGTTLAADRSNPDFPTFAVTNGVDLRNPANLAFRQYELSQVPRVEDEWSYDANVAKKLVVAQMPLTLAGGVRLSRKDSAQAQPLTVRYTGLTGATAAALATSYDGAKFMPDSGGRAVILPVYPDWKKYDAIARATPGQFTQTAAAVNFTQLTRANADFSSTEDINAAYVSATGDFGKLRLLAGIRTEETSNSSLANKVSVNSAGAVTAVSRVSASRSYRNTMPGVHARWLALRDRLVLRAAYTEGLSRPAPADLIASVQENVQLNQRNIGNPDLAPATSQNFDASVEYYLPRLGVVSASVFRKDIEKFVFTSSRTAADGVRENLKVNGDGGKLTGLELVWQQNLTFLPAPLDGLGLEFNSTWLASEGRYPGRTSEELAFVLAPRTIFNGILSYARGPFGARVSYNAIAKRLESVGASALLDTYNAKIGTWDLAFKYRLFRSTNFFCNVKNLTNEPSVIYQGRRANPTAIVYYGTQFNLGLTLDL